MENLELPGGGCYLEQVVTAHSREPKVLPDRRNSRFRLCLCIFQRLLISIWFSMLERERHSLDCLNHGVFLTAKHSMSFWIKKEV